MEERREDEHRGACREHAALPARRPGGVPQDRRRGRPQSQRLQEDGAQVRQVGRRRQLGPGPRHGVRVGGQQGEGPEGGPRHRVEGEQPLRDLLVWLRSRGGRGTGRQARQAPGLGRLYVVGHPLQEPPASGRRRRGEQRVVGPAAQPEEVVGHVLVVSRPVTQDGAADRPPPGCRPGSPGELTGLVHLGDEALGLLGDRDADRTGEAVHRGPGVENGLVERTPAGRLLRPGDENTSGLEVGKCRGLLPGGCGERPGVPASTRCTCSGDRTTVSSRPGIRTRTGPGP
ncbi:hypothetical protein Gobs01_03577 [Geodermatophilus obscurus DSM 43160]